MIKLRLYNTLTRKKEEFKPIKKNSIGLYTCGPTVYNYAHIGNLRAYVFSDTLARVLKYNFGPKNVCWVMNITDVDDKTIRDSKQAYPGLEPKIALAKFTLEYENHFWADMNKMNISAPNLTPHASAEKYLKEMRQLIKKIYDKKIAYIKDGSVYFNVLEYNKKNSYGRLINLDLASLKSGLRIDLDEYGKENIQDFVLWKGKKPGEPFWEFELAGKKLPGRPGWHIECSAMGKAELGMPFDIHTGGEDLKFPHHEDEIAQSVVGYGVPRPVNFWLHNGMLMVDGKKMSKSLKNFYNLRDIKERGIGRLSFRYFCLMTHYRKPLDFSWEAITAAQNGLEHLRNQVRRLSINNRELRIKEVNQESKNKFLAAVNDDLNTPKALAVTQEVLKSNLPAEEKLAAVLDFDKVLGLALATAIKPEEIPEAIKKIAAARQSARDNKDFKMSDKLRLKLEKLGYLVEDTKNGQRLSKK